MLFMMLCHALPRRAACSGGAERGLFISRRLALNNPKRISIRSNISHIMADLFPKPSSFKAGLAQLVKIVNELTEADFPAREIDIVNARTINHLIFLVKELINWEFTNVSAKNTIL